MTDRKKRGFEPRHCSPPAPHQLLFLKYSQDNRRQKTKNYSTNLYYYAHVCISPLVASSCQINARIQLSPCTRGQECSLPPPEVPLPCSPPTPSSSLKRSISEGCPVLPTTRSRPSIGSAPGFGSTTDVSDRLPCNRYFRPCLSSSTAADLGHTPSRSHLQDAPRTRQ